MKDVMARIDRLEHSLCRGQRPMNSEWIKILVSATAGMFTGLIADPIRGLIQSRIDIAKMQDAILWDLSALSQSAIRVHDGELPAGKLWVSADLPAFDHYWNRKRELFYTSERLVSLRPHCQEVQRLKALVENKQQTPDEAMEKLWETLLVLKVVKLVPEDSTWERITQRVFRRKQSHCVAE
jgi:hypothetical protein